MHHYTSFDGLTGIIGTTRSEPVKLKITNVENLNDRCELFSGLKEIEKIDGLLGIPLVNQSIASLSSMSKKLGCFSLSERPDSVPLWMNYGVRGAGANIGFCTKQLLFLDKFLLVKTIYDKNAKARFLSAVEKALSKFIDDCSRFKVDESLAIHVKWLVFAIAMSLKSEDWDYEFEWRLVLIDEIQNTEYKNSDFRRAQDFHMKICLGVAPQANDSLSLLLRESETNSSTIIPQIVYVGPKWSDEKVKEIENYFRSVGIDSTVTKPSGCPLR